MDKTYRAEPTTMETIQVEGSRLVEQVRQLLHEGNVRRILVKQGDQTIAEFPFALGVVGALLAAPLAALGALAALLNDCTITVERTDLTPVSVLAAAEPAPADTIAADAQPDLSAASTQPLTDTTGEVGA